MKKEYKEALEKAHVLKFLATLKKYNSSWVESCSNCSASNGECYMIAAQGRCKTWNGITDKEEAIKEIGGGYGKAVKNENERSEKRMNRWSKMEELVGRRFEDLEDLKETIENLTHEKVVGIIESESDRIEYLDFMIDLEFEDDGDVYTIFYLKDNGGRYYITEV